MSLHRQHSIIRLLKGIESGDPQAVEVIHPDTYIQHNPQTHEGREGLAALFQRLSKTNPRVNIVRIFSDGDYVFGQTEYDFSTRRIGFEVFRFEGAQTVEHWDNIQPRQGPNASGRSMVDGPTEVQDRDKTESHRERVRQCLEAVFIQGQWAQLDEYIAEDLIQHHPERADGRDALVADLKAADIKYQKVHRILAEGNFVLAVCEGLWQEQRTSFYELFRLEAGRIVEQWNTREKVPPPEQWKNTNGKF